MAPKKSPSPPKSIPNSPTTPRRASKAKAMATKLWNSNRNNARAHAPLNHERQAIVREFKRLHPLADYIGRRAAWIKELHEYVATFDPRVSMPDVQNWIKLHQWIVSATANDDFEFRMQQRQSSGAAVPAINNGQSLSVVNPSNQVPSTSEGARASRRDEQQVFALQTNSMAQTEVEIQHEYPLFNIPAVGLAVADATDTQDQLTQDPLGLNPVNNTQPDTTVADQAEGGGDPLHACVSFQIRVHELRQDTHTLPPKGQEILEDLNVIWRKLERLIINVVTNPVAEVVEEHDDVVEEWEFDFPETVADTIQLNPVMLD